MQRYLHKNIVDIKHLLALSLNKSLTWIWSNSDYLLSKKEIIKLEDLIKQREKGVPFAYLEGIKSFYHLDFIVDKNTLIPRPETELIIDIVKELKLQKCAMLDLGTGSGIIAITLKDLFQSWQVSACDLLSKTLNIAKKNAIKNNTNINFIQSNWFENIDGKFDLIISNPPYIAENDSHLSFLKFEPISALTSKDNGLFDIKEIIKNANNYLNKGGYLILEHGYNQRDEILELLGNYCNIKTFNDLNSQHRVILAQCC